MITISRKCDLAKNLLIEKATAWSHYRLKQMCTQLATFAALLIAKFCFLLTMATKTVAAWTTGPFYSSDNFPFIREIQAKYSH